MYCTTVKRQWIYYEVFYILNICSEIKYLKRNRTTYKDIFFVINRSFCNLIPINAKCFKK